MPSATPDVVIVGAGIAGLTCALELLEQGRRVLLLDRDSRERLGGLARLSFGGMFAVDTPEQRRAGIHDSVELARADWRAFAEFDAQAQWPQRWARAIVFQGGAAHPRMLLDHKISFFCHPCRQQRNRNPRLVKFLPRLRQAGKGFVGLPTA